MPEITELLERTTPQRPPAFDVADLARRGQRRRQRRQVGTGLGGVAVVAAAVAALGLVAPGDQGQVVASRPPTGELAKAFAASEAPLGTWEQLPAPPFSPRTGSFTGTTPDGRVVVWGGSPDNERHGVLTDGGVYDPETGAWVAIPSAPLSAGVQFDPMPDRTQLASDRLMVLGGRDRDGRMEVEAAVYDMAAGEWTRIDAPPTIELPAEGVAWTGDTLALVRFWSGASVDTVASYTEPVVERWLYATGEWETGAEPPLSNRFGPNVAFDDGRLGVWGGSRQGVELGKAPAGAELMGDGAIYDVAADRWEAMPASPLPPSMQGAAIWLESGRFAVAGGVVEDTSGRSTSSSSIAGIALERLSAGAIFDPATERWFSLPEPPEDRPRPQDDVGTFSIRANEHTLIAQDGLYLRTWFYDEEVRSWIETPLSDLHAIGGTPVATGGPFGRPRTDPYGVQVLAGSVWEAAAEAPFVNRMDAGVAVVGQELFVVGGAEGPDLEVTGDAWVLRFDP